MWVKAAATARQEAWAEGFEHGLWMSSDQIVLVEIVSLGTAELKNSLGEVNATSPEAIVRVVHSLRGDAKPGVTPD
jgi:hypothetical protein